jgi:nicotinamidase-related amidase
VEPRSGEVVFQKNYPNSFRGTPLLDYLRDQGVEQVVVGGMMTHMCVDATVRAAFDYNLTVTVVHDACAARTLAFKGQTVSAAEVQAAFFSCP